MCNEENEKTSDKNKPMNRTYEMPPRMYSSEWDEWFDKFFEEHLKIYFINFDAFANYVMSRPVDKINNHGTSGDSEFWRAREYNKRFCPDCKKARLDAYMLEIESYGRKYV